MNDTIDDEGRRLLREYRKAKFTFMAIDKSATAALTLASIEMFQAAKRLADHLAFNERFPRR